MTKEVFLVKRKVWGTTSKLSALTRLARFLPFDQKRTLMSAFIDSQFSNSSYPLIWMFCTKEQNNKINNVHKRALRQVYSDFNSTFAELLDKDNAVTVHQRNIQLVAIEMFKATKELGPKIVRDLFENKIRTEGVMLFFLGLMSITKLLVRIL